MSVINKAKKLSALQLAELIGLKGVPEDEEFSLQVMWSQDLVETERRQVWSLFEENMHQLYVSSSFGWDPTSKRHELFHVDSRFLVIRHNMDKERKRKTGEPLELADIVAYTMFRFEREAGQRVLYCYELQVSKAMFRRGHGRLLLSKLLCLGRECHMDKVMLTLIKANEHAAAFYSALGFVEDPTSPGFVVEDPDDSWEDEDLDEVDYMILSKRIE